MCYFYSKMKQVKIEKMTHVHWEEVRKIYIEGINTGNATFEQTCPEWEEWDKAHLDSCRFVATDKDTVLGWAALSPISQRCVYGGVCEVSVYVAGHHRGKGIGMQLLDALISESEKQGIWTLQAGIFLENKGSIHLHKRSGFREVGTREKLGKMFGVWRDVVLLERRSKTID